MCGQVDAVKRRAKVPGRVPLLVLGQMDTSNNSTQQHLVSVRNCVCPRWSGLGHGQSSLGVEALEEDRVLDSQVTTVHSSLVNNEHNLATVSRDPSSWSSLPPRKRKAVHSQHQSSPQMIHRISRSAGAAAGILVMHLSQQLRQV